MHRIRQAALALTVAALAAAMVASSASAAPTSSTSTVRGAATLYLPGIFVVKHRVVTVPGRTVSVTGVVRPYVAGQWVQVRSYLGHRLIKRDRLRLKPAPNGRSGKFTEKFASPGAGTVTVKVKHPASATMGAFTAQRRFSSLDENVNFGSTGPFVQLVQQQLAALHFYLPQSGVYDSFTGLAIDAYHRLLSQGVSQDLNKQTTSELLDGEGRFQVKFPGQGFHVEGDLTHQLLALIDGSTVKYIFPISSGKPSTPTILGSFRVYERVPGYLPDGMYYSDFFIRGYAVHGYDPAPDYPASHGCMRLPIQDAIFVFNQLAIGDWVDSYYR
jgi:peptidoglycan hydrolase-like protein with peptidoglycan-binding domain